MEKSHASGPPGPGTQTSAGRREEMEGSGGSGLLRAIVVRGVPRDQEAWLFQDSGKVGPIVGCRVDNVSNQIAAGDPVTATPASQGVVTPFIHDLTAKRTVRVLGPDRACGHDDGGRPETRVRGCETRGSPAGRRAKRPPLEYG